MLSNINTYMLTYYLTFNIVHWLSCLICYRHDNTILTEKAFRKTFINITFLSIIPIIVLGSIIPKLDFSLSRTLIHLSVMFLTVDFWFHISHYIFHTKLLYTYHKIHHEFKYPVGMVAFYCHWLEFYFNNILPVAMTGLLLGSDMITMNIWLAITVFNAVYVSHSVRTSDKFHLDHHVYVTGNYGIGMYMDKLCGTLVEK